MTHITFHNAVVTGACGGLGQALASELIHRGARVALVGLNAEALGKLAALAPERCAIYRPDVTDTHSMQAMATDWIGRFGLVTVHTVCPGYLRTALTAHNHFAMPGLMEPADAARALLQGVARGREFLVLPRRLGWLARLLNLLPARLHDRLLLSQPRKARVGEAGATAIPGLTPTQTD